MIFLYKLFPNKLILMINMSIYLFNGARLLKHGVLISEIGLGRKKFPTKLTQTSSKIELIWTEFWFGSVWFIQNKIVKIILKLIIKIFIINKVITWSFNYHN